MFIKYRATLHCLISVSGMITLPFNMVSNTTVECTPDKNSGNATDDGGGGGSSYTEQKMVRFEQKFGREVS